MDWHTRIRAAFAAERHVPDDGVIEELAQHAAATYAAARADGRSHEDAERQVQDQLASWCREAALLRRRPRRPPLIEPPPASTSGLVGIAHDMRYAMRLLRRRPGYTLVAVLTMALGIGATTALFSVAHGVLLKPLPWPDADRLVRLSETRPGGTNRFPWVMTNATYLAWQEQPSTIEEMAAWRGDTVTMTGAGEPERLRIVAATPSLFPLVRAQPLLGTLFGPDDDRGGAVALSYGLWQQRFGGDPDVIGRLIRFDGEPHRVAAVMPRAFAFPDRETRAWVPLRVRPVMGDDPNARSLSMFNAVARLRPGATAAQAAAEGTARGRFAPDLGLVGIAVFGTKAPAEVSAVPYLDAMTADVRPALVVFLIAVGLLLATATANVASLQLARATTRRREIAIRSALGAGNGRLARQLLVESALVGLAGGLVGLLLAAALHRALPSLLPADFPRLDEVSVDLRVTAFAVGLSLLTGVVFGLIPVLQARRLDLVESLAEDSLAPVGGGSRSRTARARTLIMAGQVAIACVLLLGASLLVRSFVALMSADRGYDPSNLLTAALVLPDASYTPQRRAQFLDTLLERLRATAGVREAAVTTILPLTSREAMMGFTMPPRGSASGETVQAHASMRSVSPGYFAALGVRLIEGRAFTDADTTASLPVVVVNRTFATRYLGDAALGTKLPLQLNEGQPDWEVVGVVDDLRQRSVTDPAQPEIFASYRQRATGFGSSEAYLVVRTASDPAAFVPTLRALVREQDPSLALESVMTMEDRLVTSLARPRLYAVLLGGFAIFALAIAGVGLFGVLSYTVAQRAREIGVRTALGARPLDIVRLVVGQGLAMTLGGLAVGLAASFALVRYLSTFLYGVTAYDAVSFVAVPIVLTAVAGAACVVPARRAARVDPLRVLKAG